MNTAEKDGDMREYLEERINHYYELRQICYEQRTSTYSIDLLINELEFALTHFNQINP